mgnify:CR=1 FL=1
MSEESFKMKPWMWVLLLIAALLLVFNFDPVGKALNNAFGNGADKLAISIVVIALIIYFLVVTKKK